MFDVVARRDCCGDGHFGRMRRCERLEESSSVKRAWAEADVDIICWAGMILFYVLY